MATDAVSDWVDRPENPTAKQARLATQAKELIWLSLAPDGAGAVSRAQLVPFQARTWLEKLEPSEAV